MLEKIKAHDIRKIGGSKLLDLLIKHVRTALTDTNLSDKHFIELSEIVRSDEHLEQKLAKKGALNFEIRRIHTILNLGCIRSMDRMARGY